MTNKLVKETRDTFLPGSPGVPSVPGKPATGAYTSYEKQTVCSWVGTSTANTQGSWQWVLDNSLVPPQYSYVFVPSGSGGGTGMTGYSFYCREETVPVYHPAQPATDPIPGTPSTPDQTIYDFDLGWNAGARSNPFLRGDGYYQFSAPYSLVGACTGLSDEDPDADYLSIKHGWYFSGKVARVYERGVPKFYAGPYSDLEVFKIERKAGAINYYKGGTLVYTSLLAAPKTTLFADASLYSGGDYLDAPSIVGYSGSGNSGSSSGSDTTGAGGTGTSSDPRFDGAMVLPALRVMGSDRALAQGTMVLPKFSVSAGMLNGAAMRLPALQMFGGRTNASGTFGQAVMSLPALAIDAPAVRSTVPQYALAGMVLPTLGMSALGLTGEIGGATMRLPAPVLRGADHAYGEAHLKLPALRMYGNAYEGNSNASMMELTGTTAPMSMGLQLVVAINAAGEVTSVMAAQMVADSATGVTPPGQWGQDTPPAQGGGTGGLGGSGGMGGDMSAAATLGAESVLYALMPSMATMDAYVPVAGGITTGTPSPISTVTGTVTGTGTGTGAVAVVGTVTGIGGSTGAGTLTGTLTLADGTVVTGPITGTVNGTVNAGGVFEGTFTGTDANGNVITGTVTGVVTPVAEVTGTVTGVGDGTGTVPITGTVTGVDGTSGSGTLVGTVTLPDGTVVTGPVSGVVTGTVDDQGNFTGSFTGVDSNGAPVTGTVSGVVVTHEVGSATGTVTGTGTGTGVVAVTGVVYVGGTVPAGTLLGTLTLPDGTTVTGPITGTVTGTIGPGGVFTGTFTGTDANGNVITGTVTGTVAALFIPGALHGPLVDGNTVWVVNWDSSASSRYEQFSFNSFALLGGQYYGAKTDGIYLLDGDTDAGADIKASVSFGKQNFGSKLLKRVPNVYVGVASTGRVVLKVVDGEREYLYSARRSDERMAVQRFDLGKGLSANYLTFELWNSEGADFELDDIEFHFAELTRRI